MVKLTFFLKTANGEIYIFFDLSTSRLEVRGEEGENSYKKRNCHNRDDALNARYIVERNRVVVAQVNRNELRRPKRTRTRMHTEELVSAPHC